MEGHTPREQKLVDLMFAMLLGLSPAFADFSDRHKAEWLIDQLKQIGFVTQPQGSSWAVLDPMAKCQCPRLKICPRCERPIS